MGAGTVLQCLREQIAAKLRGELLSGQFAPGEPMREESLAERFGVSRMPIRQVLHELAHEGLLIAKPNCGVSVAPPPTAVVRQALTPVRATLEEFALHTGFGLFTAAHFAAWERVLRKLRIACESGDRGDILDADFTFHELLFHHAGLADLIPVWRPVISRLRVFHEHRNQRIADLDLMVVHQVHVELLAAIQSDNQERAEQALKSHIEDGDFNEKVRRKFHAKLRRAKSS